MSKLFGTIINDTIYPASTEERFATHDALYGKGGYRSVNNIAERDAIPRERLVIGCEVRVMEEENSPVYYLKSLDPITWELIGSGNVDEEQVNSIIQSNKGVPDGIASLDSDGKLAESQIPDSIKGAVIQGTYVDETTFWNELGIVITPNKNTVYVDSNTKSIYTWNGESYITEDFDWIIVE